MTHAFLFAILRTTCCTIVAAVLAHFLLRANRTLSPATHRVVWCLVLLQGWAHIPIALAYQAPPARDSIPQITQMQSFATTLPANAVRVNEPPLHPTIQEVTPSPFQLACLTIAALWLVGMVIVIGYFVNRYRSLVANMPLGRAITESNWKNEWKRISREVADRRKPQFRLTDDVGPLCCYVPFFYLILAPERLWRTFQPAQREQVLRHELAHVVRGDLWKSAAIRILTLPQWFNPVAWLAVRRFDEAGEWACDDLVVRNCQKTSAQYSNTLLELANTYSQPLASTVGMRGGVLARRVNRLVNPTFTEESKMSKLFLPTIFLLLFAIQSVRIVAADGEPQQQPNATTPATTGVQTPPKIAPPAETRTTETRTAALARTGLRPYRVAPPDILRINVKKLTPKPVYQIGQSDYLQVVVSGLPEDATPIAGTFQVNNEGKITLGISYGSVEVEGSTTAEAEQLITKHLQEREDQNVDASVSLLQISSTAAVAGDHLISPDGHLNLGPLGRVQAAGLTTDEVRVAVEEKLKKSFDEAKISVEILTFNSKCFYVIIGPNSPSSSVLRLPITGNETVLDAIAHVGGHEQVSKHQILIARRRPDNSQDDIFHVDWSAIIKGGGPRLLPGDRLYVNHRFVQDASLPKLPAAQANVPPAREIVVPPEYALLTGAEQQVTIRGRQGKIIAMRPSVACPIPAQRSAKFRIRIEVLSDANKNLDEYWSDQTGSAVLVDSDQLSATLRILIKNNIIDRQMAPTVTCSGNQNATVEVNDFHIKATPRVTTQEHVMLMTQIKTGAPQEAIDANAVLRHGDTLLVRTSDKNAANGSDQIFVAIVAQLVR